MSHSLATIPVAVVLFFLHKSFFCPLLWVGYATGRGVFLCYELEEVITSGETGHVLYPLFHRDCVYGVVECDAVYVYQRKMDFSFFVGKENVGVVHVVVEYSAFVHLGKEVCQGFGYVFVPFFFFKGIADLGAMG